MNGRGPPRRFGRGAASPRAGLSRQPPPVVGKARVWRAILRCRTRRWSGHVETCDACGTTRHVYHPVATGIARNARRAKAAWLARRRRELLPVPYFHLVFTLSHDLNGLIGMAPRAIYETLFGAVSATLTEFAANPLAEAGRRPSPVLHTEAGSGAACPCPCAGGRRGAV
ncbi:MAG: transposase zinc-binding domain-containing protein [Propionivibrio sp.]|uniref:transposase zinc-binding domain-containing protein n=1 Tax=Propionivibrio sp. TaxID=2212460 RepID=UPI0025FC9643|nr:transposase zinc-binding domain-containing protein [Propionivibrio sp.]MBK8894542.1 transposase zinc-binding domain-containing protein [Propionivibrio sp.]